ncbi:MAG: hypothetical protein M3419_04960 [Actinomycetota bacterium]|nr:hypothetical protein [Actinomycetota bacterium]
MSSTEWVRAVEAYLRHLQAAGSPYGTIRLRRHWLGHVARHVGVGPWEVTPAQLVDFLSAPRWRPETRKSARTTIRSFYTWALDQELIAVDPSRRLPTVRIPTALPKPCPDDVIQAALAGADPDERLMLLLAATAGLRIHEIAKVARRDVQHRVDGYALDVLGKGGKQRLVPLSDSLAAELLAARTATCSPTRSRGTSPRPGSGAGSSGC